MGWAGRNGGLEQAVLMAAYALRRVLMRAIIKSSTEPGNQADPVSTSVLNRGSRPRH